ncbi:MAG: DNA/RNA non-specific endonuclease, partial [Flavobacteriaceae bacterium]|nr:DNA/RNA non-specific endonuclease [Flavobacteriaceae bacterium]
ERAAQIIDLVQAFVDSIGAIAKGNVGAVAKSIETALSRGIPLLIGVLAAVLGLGGITKKVKKIIEKVRKPIIKGIKKLWYKIKKKAGKFLKKFKKKGGAKKIKEDNKKGKPEKLTAKDKAKHKKIANKIAKQLEKPAKKGEKITFEKFHKRKKKEADKLEDKYQPQLKKGINLDIKMTPVAADKKDGDVDMKIKIAPNDTVVNTSAAISGGVSGWLLTSNSLKEYKKSELEITENQAGKAFVGYKAKETKNNQKGVIVGQSGKKNSFIKELEENKDYGKLFSKLKDANVAKRRNIIGSGSDHNKFFPVDIKERPLSEGKKEITYTYAEGEQKFTIVLDANGYPISAKGDKLTLHDLGRGTTQNSDGKIINSGMDSAHLIANMFGGSGYKIAENIVATSAEYNQIVMRKEEDKILKFIKDNENTDHFTLQVDLEFVGENTTFEVAEIRKTLEKHTKDDDERRSLTDSELLQQIEKRLEQTDQQRVKKVEYLIELLDSNGNEIDFKEFNIKEADLLFGTK